MNKSLLIWISLYLNSETELLVDTNIKSTALEVSSVNAKTAILTPALTCEEQSELPQEPGTHAGNLLGHHVEHGPHQGFEGSKGEIQYRLYICPAVCVEKLILFHSLFIPTLHYYSIIMPQQHDFIIIQQTALYGTVLLRDHNCVCIAHSHPAFELMQLSLTTSWMDYLCLFHPPPHGPRTRVITSNLRKQIPTKLICLLPFPRRLWSVPV